MCFEWFLDRLNCSYVMSSFFFFKQKTTYEMRISDWSSDVCSSDLRHPRTPQAPHRCRGCNRTQLLPKPLLAFQSQARPVRPENLRDTPAHERDRVRLRQRQCPGFDKDQAPHRTSRTSGGIRIGVCYVACSRRVTESTRPRRDHRVPSTTGR